MSGTADNDDEMYSSYISKGRLVSIDEMLWGTGDYDSLDDDYNTIELASVEYIHSMSDDKVFCAQELQESSGDIEFGYSNGCDSGDIVLSYGLASKLNGIMIVYAVSYDYISATMTLKKSYQETMNFYNCRYWFDRGKNRSLW